jgi:ribonucleoside-diphosphate reductase alpha chain
MAEIGSKILSDIVVFSKYARYIPDLNRRETWDEIVDRSVNMYNELFPSLTQDIEKAYEFVRRKEVMPSMRSCQFAGAPILKNNARVYNCSYLPINHYQAFAEVIYLLLLGVGVGWSVRRRHVYSLPSLTAPGQSRKFVIADSVEGWADSVKALMKAYLCGASLPKFDFSDIRAKGSPLSSGGLAPGPELGTR